ncbi:hypothetical protein [Pseudomonas sp. 5P_3.1_Bac2]|uniref:hypothetical protein n=1 Tax=Pseudomonas sp. 5P_3.1_Bac2 TaxID=2971617 RepID=UPI0021CA57C2|nr:hypothetical protein [Pseudomonas sp. 5P_3.1_Bac2]MCU1717309.1 hypothetical protein [Pseudomonas sp. 5P_3.1_Bac2]
MSGGGGKTDNSIQDTPEQKYAAQVAAEKWNYAQERLAPVENAYMKRVDDMDSAGSMAYVRGKANAGTQQALTSGMKQVSQGMTQQYGLNPNSGRFIGAQGDLAASVGTAGGDTMARAQFEQKGQKIAGLNSVAAIGQGQSSQAQAGLNTVANQAAQDAQSAAFTNFNRKSANLQLAGAAMGAVAGGAAYGLNNMAPAKTNLANSSVLNPKGLSGNIYDSANGAANFGGYA